MCRGVCDQRHTVQFRSSSPTCDYDQLDKIIIRQLPLWPGTRPRFRQIDVVRVILSVWFHRIYIQYDFLQQHAVVRVVPYTTPTILMHLRLFPLFNSIFTLTSSSTSTSCPAHHLNASYHIGLDLKSMHNGLSWGWKRCISPIPLDPGKKQLATSTPPIPTSSLPFKTWIDNMEVGFVSLDAYH